MKQLAEVQNSNAISPTVDQEKNKTPRKKPPKFNHRMSILKIVDDRKTDEINVKRREHGVDYIKMAN